MTNEDILTFKENSTRFGYSSSEDKSHPLTRTRIIKNHPDKV